MKENWLHLCGSIIFNTFRVEMGKNVLIPKENFNSIQFIQSCLQYETLSNILDNSRLEESRLSG